MKRDEKVINAKRKMLEAEVEMLEETIKDSLHWNRPSDIREPLKRVRKLAQELANALDLGVLD